MPDGLRSDAIVIGVDTHKHIHVAVALSRTGERLADTTIRADPRGYAQLLIAARVGSDGGIGEPFAGAAERDRDVDVLVRVDADHDRVASKPVWHSLHWPPFLDWWS